MKKIVGTKANAQEDNSGAIHLPPIYVARFDEVSVLRESLDAIVQSQTKALILLTHEIGRKSEGLWSEVYREFNLDPKQLYRYHRGVLTPVEGKP